MVPPKVSSHSCRNFVLPNIQNHLGAQTYCVGTDFIHNQFTKSLKSLKIQIQTARSRLHLNKFKQPKVNFSAFCNLYSIVLPSGPSGDFSRDLHILVILVEKRKSNEFYYEEYECILFAIRRKNADRNPRTRETMLMENFRGVAGHLQFFCAQTNTNFG